VKQPYQLADLMGQVNDRVHSHEDAVAVKALIARAFMLGAVEPPPTKPFPGTLAHLRPVGRGGKNRGVITVAIDGNRFALAFSSPVEQWDRQKGISIALARLAGNPIRVEANEGEGVLLPPLMVMAAKSLVQDRPGWSHVEGTRSWKTSILGPDGLIFHLQIDTKERLQDVPAPRTISWLRIPSWAPKLIQEVP